MTPPDHTKIGQHMSVSLALVELTLAAMDVARLWSALAHPPTELEPAMQRLQHALGPVLGWPQRLEEETP